MRRMMMFPILSVLLLTSGGCERKDEVSKTTRLHWAAREGDIDAVRSLIEDGCEVDARNERGDTPLDTAVNFDQIDVARFLISRGADVSAATSKSGNLLRGAKSAEMARLLIGAGARVDPNVLYMSPPPHDGGAVEVFLAHGAQIRPGDTPDNEDLLLFAVRNRLPDLVEKLLVGGANPDAVSIYTGCTALTEAANYGYKDVALLLINHGADVNKADRNHRRPLWYATGRTREIAELLLAHGADANAGGLLYNAVARGEQEIVELLLAHGADVNATDWRGRTPMDEAFAQGFAEIVEILHRYGGVRSNQEADPATVR